MVSVSPRVHPLACCWRRRLRRKRLARAVFVRNLADVVRFTWQVPPLGKITDLVNRDHSR